MYFGAVLPARKWRNIVALLGLLVVIDADAQQT